MFRDIADRNKREGSAPNLLYPMGDQSQAKTSRFN